MREPKATQLSDEARQVLMEMLNSGDSQQVYVAAALDEIASNGDTDPQQARDAILMQCASEIKMAALCFSERLTALRREAIDRDQSEAG